MRQDPRGVGGWLHRRGDACGPGAGTRERPASHAVSSAQNTASDEATKDDLFTPFHKVKALSSRTSPPPMTGPAPARTL